jgi:Bax protein
MLNLNSHPAYKKMRHYRTITLKEGNVLSGYDTSNYLDQYAEIGYEYVLKVTSLIKNNKFDSFDNIKLEKLN